MLKLLKLHVISSILKYKLNENTEFEIIQILNNYIEKQKDLKSKISQNANLKEEIKRINEISDKIITKNENLHQSLKKITLSF